LEDQYDILNHLLNVSVVVQCSFQTSLEEKHIDLLAERGKQERLAASITDQMYMEAQVFAL
jgi:hypothetical protein